MSTLQVHEGNTLYQQYFLVFPRMSVLLSQLADEFFGDTVGTVAKEAITDTLSRMTHTSKALDCKYAFSYASLVGEELSIAYSGFPNKSEISGMFAEWSNLDESKDRLQSVDIQKMQWLEKAAATGEDDAELLWQIGDRLYIDLLDKERMMLPMVLGSITYEGLNAHEEHMYTFWWSCYSSTSNSPAIHVLQLTQDNQDDVDPLHKNGQSYETFLRVIQRIGTRTPNLCLVAHDIDNELPHIHPKRLIRLTMENLYTRSSEFPEKDSDAKEAAASQYFEHFAQDDRKDVLMLRMFLDIVTSKRTEETGSALFGTKQRREVFHLEQNGLAYDRGATLSHQYLLVPHRMMQIRNSDQGKFLEPIFDDDVEQILTYTRGDEINAI